MRRKTAKIGLATILALILSNLSMTAQMAPPAQEPLPPHGLLADFAGPPFLDTGLARPAPDQASPAYILDPGSKFVFQSFRDHIWDIYASRDDGSEEVRLTASSAPDIHPRFNRGCTRIVFASKPSSNYDIWAMNADGTGAVRLTTDPADDVYPAWSPDGTKIAFTSYRDGQAEIYVMNADGSGQSRLTWDADYDSQPAWSPDGTRIAFVSRRTGGYRIYVMNADGSEPTMLSTESYSENPVWSPDGSQIAYDSDGNGDGWQELWLMDVDGNNQHELYDPSTPEADALARGWSPDGQHISFTEVHYIYYQGQWYWTNAYIESYRLTGGGDGVRAGVGMDWYPDWQTTDVWPPVSSVQALPAQSPAPIAVTWPAYDVGEAGLKDYDVQVAEDGGGWSDWLVHTSATAAAYPGVGGHSYCFRSRARDRAYNVEEWPAAADTCTTVENLPPKTTFDRLPRYTRGQYLNVSWGGVDPGGSGIKNYDVQYMDLDVGSWTGWMTGTYETWGSISGVLGHTYAFRCRGTDNAENIEPWPAGADTVSTLYWWAITGTVHANCGNPVAEAIATTIPASFEAHPSDVDGTYAAYVATEITTTYGVGWSKPGYGELPETAFRNDFDAHLDVVLPPADNIVQNWGFEEGLAAWTAGGVITPVVTGTVYHTGERAAVLGCQQPGFTPVRDLSNNFVQANDPRIAVSEAGDVHVIWENHIGGITGTIYYIYQSPDGEWSSPLNLSAGGSGDTAYAPAIVLDPTGALHAFWTQGGPGSLDLYYARRAPDGSWSTPLLFSEEHGSDAPAQLAVDPGGNLHVVWASAAVLYYARRAPDGGTDRAAERHGEYRAAKVLCGARGRPARAGERDGGAGG